MSTNFRYPNINGLTEKEQLAQIRSFLHQLVEQLNYTIGTSDGTSQSSAPSTTVGQGSDMSYYELRSLIINDLQQLDNKFEQLSKKVFEDVETAVTTSLQEAKDSGEFKGEKGDPGKDGYTPVKGEDYFTEEEIGSVATQAAGRISFSLDEEGNLYYEVEE